MAHVTKEMLRERFVEAGLESFWPQLEPLIRSSIKINSSRCQEDSLQVGASKRGGTPDLPTGFVWPERDGQQCGFLCQINLAEVLPYDTGKLLPEAGLLSFFLREDFIGGEVDSDPVFYFPPEVPLERYPVAQETLFGVLKISFDFTWLIPNSWSGKLDFLDSNPEAEAKFEDVMNVLHDMSGAGVFETMAAIAIAEGETTLPDVLRQLLTPPAEPLDPLMGCVSLGGDSLLGYPDDYQGAQEPECELIYRGLVKGSHGDRPENYQALWQEVKEQAFQDWICLLDTSDGVGVFSLSYCIRRYDLEGWDFTKTVMIAVN
ncbi:DUF1963 domain-containing protein [Armatimonas sp.]|uniref:DUF1963 domain-containing protein n=1 Tax=Armatimonas sp. TaxID=1872638 RepID=UPI00286A7830|nr:DUF1963 domain-containing protein [Armatimonas sp.]